MDKMSCVHVVSFCNLIGTARERRRKSIAFPTYVTRLSPPPFSRREPGDEAGKLLELSSSNVRGRKLARDTSLSPWEEQ